MHEEHSKGKSIGLFALALLMLLCGGAMTVLWLHQLVLRSLGLVLCVGGVYLIEASNIGGIKDVLAAKRHGSDADESRHRPSPFT